MIPNRSSYVVVGAGIHGLSTAYHLAKELRERDLGSGSDIVVLDKAHPGAGASGIACGVVRNNYFQPAMSELMQACVEVWESDPAAYAYNAVGYIALGASVQEADLAETFSRQERIGYRSELIVGEAEVDAHMKALFPDWRAQGVTVCLHEHQGGFAFNMDSVEGLHGKCREEGVVVHSGVEVLGLVDGRTGRSPPSRPPRGGSRSASRSWSRRARGRSGSGPCSGCRRRSTCTRPLATSSATGRCGRTGTCRRARSASTRSCSRPPTVARRRSSTSTPTRRSTPTGGSW